MRKPLFVLVVGSFFALSATVGCGDDDDDGSGGTGGTAGKGGSAGTAGTAGTAGSAGTGGDGGTTLAQCKADALGDICNECACDNCLTQIAACNAKPKCRAILNCAVSTHCRGIADCTSKCAAEVAAAADDANLSIAVAQCQGPACTTQCSTPFDGGSGDDSGSDSGGNDAGSDAESSDASTD